MRLGLALLLFALPLVAYAQQPVALQYFRPYDQPGIYFFEPPKIDTVGYDGFDIYAGWFVTPNILVKGEYVRQNYDDFPVTDIRHGGAFNGLVIEGVLAF